MKLLINELDEKIYESMLASIIQDLIMDVDTKDYGEYLRKYYTHKAL